MVGTSIRERLRQGTEKLLARSVQEITLDKIEPDPEQPRKTRDPQKAAELAASIRAQGVISPILVTQIPETDRYRIVFGERRYYAAQDAGLTTIPCVVREKLDPLQTLLYQLTENDQREDPRPLEVAASLSRLESEFSLGRSEIARLLGRQPSYVTNMLSLLSTTGPAREALQEGHIRDAETTRLFQQLPEATKDALLAEARYSNLPIRRSAVRMALLKSPPQTAAPPRQAEVTRDTPVDAAAEPLADSEDSAPGSAVPLPEVTPSAHTSGAAAEAPARRGRPAKPRQHQVQLPPLSWQELQRLFELLDLEPPTNPSDLDEAFERLRQALS